ncbi:MAG TPA: MFS transporter [Dehalococcoidia bacterium]|nr:MFS transporter [Dehalococcoidia bacterium]
MRSLFSGLVPVFVLAHLSHHLVTALPVPLLPFIRDEFALDYTRAGFVISAFGLVYGASQLPAGWLADRIGPRALLTIGISGVALTGLLTGLSQNYLMLILSLVLMGILGGGYHPASTTMLSVAVAPKNRGQALGFHMVGGSASYFLAPLIAAGMAAIWGWRSPFIGLAIPAFGLGILLHVLVRRRVAPRKAEAKASLGPSGAPPTPGRIPRLAALVILSTFVQAILMSIVAFVPLFLVDNFGTSKETAAASMSLIYATGLLAGPLGGYLADRFGKASMILAMSFLSGVIIYLLNVTPYGLGIAAILVLIGTAMYVNTTASQAYIADQISERRRSTVLGLYFFGNMEGSGILTPVLGYLIDQLGFQPTFAITGAALLAASLACAIFLWIRPR